MALCRDGPSCRHHLRSTGEHAVKPCSAIAADRIIGAEPPARRSCSAESASRVDGAGNCANWRVLKGHITNRYRASCLRTRRGCWPQKNDLRYSSRIKGELSFVREETGWRTILYELSPERYEDEAEQKKSLELFRNNLHDTLVITFDELIDKLRHLHKFLLPPGSSV